MSALDDLIAAVEGNYILQSTDAVQVFPMPAWLHACKASQGSLDAAKALHDALLPGWKWDVTLHAAGVVDPKITYNPHYPMTGLYDGTPCQDPARAWLLAILRAYRSLQE